MPPATLVPFVVALTLQAAASSASVDDPALLQAVTRFYETQEQEDVEGYLALWSRAAARPTVEQLRFVFESGDDRFSDLRITRAAVDGARARVRLEVRRTRTRPPPAAGDPPITTTSVMRVALDFVREDDAWKLVREGPPADALALDLIEAASDEERERLLDAEADLVDVHLLAALTRHGSTAAVRQAYPQSLAIFEQIVRLARQMGHRREEGEALQNVGNALYFMRRFPEALAAYDERLTLERDRGDEAGVAAALSGIATIRYSLAEYGEALAHYREALAIQDRLDDVAGLAFTTLSIGHITYLQGDFDAAIGAYTRSLALSRSMFHADGESRALEGLGRVYTALGDYAAAVEAFERVRRDARMQSSHDRLGTVAQHLGDVHVRLGNLALARRVYEEGRRHFETRQDLPNVGRILQALAFLELVAGRFAEAEAHYKESAARCAAGDDRPCRARAIAGLGYAQFSQDSFWAAAASYRTAIAEFTALGRREDAARAEVGLSQALSGAGDMSAAIEAALRAEQEAEALDNADVRWRALAAQARAIRRIGDTRRALTPARAAAGVIARMQDAALDRPATSVPSDAAGALVLLAVLQSQTGDAGGALVTTERARALERRARLARSEREIARGMTSEDLEAERRHAAEVLTLQAQIARERELPRPDTTRIATLERLLAERTAERRVWMDALFARLPDLRTWRGLDGVPAPRDAERLLSDAGTVLLSVVLDLDAVLAITVRRAGMHVVVESHVTDVPRADVVARIAELQQPGALADAHRWRAAAGAVVSLLPEPAIAHLAAATHVVVVPHDIFWRVPFGALPIGGDVLLGRATLVAGGSLASLLHASTRQFEPNGELVAIGSPVIAPGRVERVSETAPDWLLRLAASVEAEMDLADGGGQSDPPVREPVLFVGAAATEASLRDHAAAASVLHVAAPFRLNPGTPMYSAILLAEGAPPEPSAAPAEGGAAEKAALRRAARDDGVLELRELFDVEWGAGVALLSDGGALSMREAAASADLLQWAWLAAGVPSLLVARWPAATGDAERVLARFHREVRRGALPAEALRAAQLAVRGDRATAAPLHWAGWLLMGPW